MTAPDRDDLSPWGSEDALQAGLEELLAGPSPVNRIHGAIELDGHARPAPRPSQDGIDAARNEILAALWGEEL
jgi:hypothetical protein